MDVNRKPTILVVDDSPSIRYEVKAILEKEGYVVRAAGTEIGMLNSIEEYGQVADLVLMDLTLNEADGFDLISKLRTFDQYRHIPVAMLTEHTDRNSVSTARSMGVKDYIAKPIEAELLIKRVKHILFVTK